MHRRSPDQDRIRLCLLVLLALTAWHWSGAILREFDSTPVPESPFSNGWIPQFRVDINHAEWSEIACLPGIGEVYAREIVQRVETHGPFHSIEELMLIRGIGERTLERIRPYIRIRTNDGQGNEVTESSGDP